MPTFSDLVEEILSNAQGFTASPDQITSLSAGIAADDTTITVDDASGLQPGLVEIGEELVWVRSVDDASSTAQVLPAGRGWRGTTAAAHDAGTTVVISPALPRSAVVREVNNVIRALYPALFQVVTVEFEINDITQVAWDIPADCEAVLDVRYKDRWGNWEPVRRWSVENSMNTTDHTTGTVLRVLGVEIWRTVQVVYGKRLTPLTSSSQEWTDCGLTDGAKDLLVLGTLARMVPMLDVARLSVRYAAAEEMDQPRPLGSALAVAKQIKADYTARLEEERLILARRYPARWHRVVR